MILELVHDPVPGEVYTGKGYSHYALLEPFVEILPGKGRCWYTSRSLPTRECPRLKMWCRWEIDVNVKVTEIDRPGQDRTCHARLFAKARRNAG